MTTDPAWFNSALAQSTAALIGLLGAVLGSRLLQRLETVRESKRRLLDDFLEMRPSSFAGPLTWARRYRDYLKREIPKNRKAAEEDEEREVQRRMQWGENPRPQSVILQPSFQRVERQEKELEAVEKLIPALQPVAEATDLSTLLDAHPKLEKVAEELPDDYGQEARTAAARLGRLVPKIERHHDKQWPHSALVILGVVAWLATIGLLAPLYNLRTSAEFHFLLAGFGVGVVALVFYLGYLAFEVRRTGLLQLPVEKQITGSE